MAGQQAKEEQRPGDPGDQFARHRRLHDSHSRQLGRPRADLVHPDVVAMAVTALRVVAQQQVRVLFRQQGGKLPAASSTSARANRDLPGGSSNRTGPCPLSA